MECRFASFFTLLPIVKYHAWFGLLVMCVTISHAEPQPEFHKWLAIGDSITQHGPKPELLWSGEVRGMAASEVQKDYVHVLQALIQERYPKSVQDVKIVGRLGKLGAGTMDQMSTVVSDLNTWGADLITIQLGENDRLSEMGAEGFEARYRGLVDGLLARSDRPVIVCTGVWAVGNPPGDQKRTYLKGSEGAIKEEIIEKICREKGLIYVPVAPFALDPANHGSGETPGVKWHPNDAGMRAYAERIFAALYAFSSKEP